MLMSMHNEGDIVIRESCNMKNWIKCTGAFYRDSVALCRPTAAAMDRDECNSPWTVSQASKLFKSVFCILPLLMVRVLDNYFFDDRPKIVT